MKTLIQKSKIGVVVLCIAMLFWGCIPTNGDNAVDSPIVLIGDSILAIGEVKNELERLSGEQYRAYYVGGSELDASRANNIPEQYDRAVSANPNIKTVILDGGGNDVQMGAGSACRGSKTSVSAACKSALQAPLNAADKLFSAMRADGVENIVYLNYFYFSSIQDKLAAFDWMHDQMEILVKKHNGIVVDPMPYMNSNYVGSDGIHPNTEGSQMLAGLIWEAMLENNVDPTGGGNGSGGCGGSF
jgi:hypothetical protein